MEKIEDIVADMRYGMIPKHRHDHELLMKFADRIEQAVTNCNQLKMREALQWIINEAHLAIYQHECDAVNKVLMDFIDKANEAFSAPARNCDVYHTKKRLNTAYKKYREHVIMSNDNPFIAQDEMMSKEEWLFDEAKGE